MLGNAARYDFSRKIAMPAAATISADFRDFHSTARPTPHLRAPGFAGIKGFWRRGWDSNPRKDFTSLNGLANRRLQPLGHPSTRE